MNTDKRSRFLDLSATQLIATAFAAITATVAGSFLGVSGTVVGAALAAVVSAIGNAVYGASLRRTGDRVRAAVPVVVPARRRPGTGPRPYTPHSQRPHASSRRSVPTRPSPRPSPGGPDQPPALPSRRPRGARAPRPAPARGMPWRGIALGSVSVFLAVLAGVTVVEAVAGRPLSDVVRGDSGSGTSVFGGTSGGGAKHVPTPTITRTVIPAVTVVTPTTTRTAPAATVTVPASSTPTVTSGTTGVASTPTPTRSGSASQSVGSTPTTLG